MKAVVQRVKQGRVDIADETGQVESVSGRIGKGLLVYLGVEKGDTPAHARWMGEKIANLRVFEQNGRLDLSAKDIEAAVLLVSSFTLAADCRKGRRPSLDPAALPKDAEKLYEMTAEAIESKGLTLEKGVFGAHMHVESTNDGPINFLLER